MSSRRIQTARYEAASVRFFSPLVWTSALSSAAMSLAFLSKKGWHTSNLQNVEKVWIAEQKQEKEDREREEREKEAARQFSSQLLSLKDERQRQERDDAQALQLLSGGVQQFDSILQV